MKALYVVFSALLFVQLVTANCFNVDCDDDNDWSCVPQPGQVDCLPTTYNCDFQDWVVKTDSTSHAATSDTVYFYRQLDNGDYCRAKFNGMAASGDNHPDECRVCRDSQLSENRDVVVKKLGVDGVGITEFNLGTNSYDYFQLSGGQQSYSVVSLHNHVIGTQYSVVFMDCSGSSSQCRMAGNWPDDDDELFTINWVRDD
mgnify:CR=1 FL=1